MIDKYDVIKGQEFDIGRTINPAKCDCRECDFLNCPKKNYVPRTRLHRYTVQEFIEYYAAYLSRSTFICDAGGLMFEGFMRLFSFPKGTYWGQGFYEDEIELVTFSRSGREVKRGSISTRTGNVRDIDMTAAQRKLADRIAKAVREVNRFIADKEGAAI